MNKANQNHKVLVIGIDGATFDLIKPWAQKGYLPSFRNLLKMGTHGILQSTIPPITGPAWASFQTGKNPGKHGIFDWLKIDKNNYNIEPINSYSIQDKVLWEIISKQGKRVGIINVPVTYPPKTVNGFLISGMLTPSKKTQYTYPLNLKIEIEKVLNDYEILPNQRFESHKVKNWIQGLRNMIRKRKQLTLFLMKKYQWDFLMVHFVATDIIQHRMWQTVKTAPNAVLEIYQEIDQAIGGIINSMPKNACIFIISDHGFGPLYYNIYLNNWFLREGYIKLKNNFSTQFKKVLYKLNITPANIYKILGKIGLLARALKLNKSQRYNLVSRFFLSAKNIDWQNTKAYSYGNIGQIYINIENKEALVKEIICELKKIAHPETGDKLFDKIYTKEAIYSGDKMSNAPDILVLPKNMESMIVGASEFISNKIIEPSFAFTGGHRMEGILIALGKNIKKGSDIKNARIIDLAPTILSCLGLTVPDDMDGRILKDLFDDDSVPKKITNRVQEKIEEEREKLRGFNNKETDEIKKRLRSLGYVS